MLQSAQMNSPDTENNGLPKGQPEPIHTLLLSCLQQPVDYNIRIVDYNASENKICFCEYIEFIA